MVARRLRRTVISLESKWGSPDGCKRFLHRKKTKLTQKLSGVQTIYGAETHKLMPQEVILIRRNPNSMKALSESAFIIAHA
jgi:sarcosine oxidase delta subunit